ncbi:hypothetical protein Tco_1124019 [Tanacetum coccineum]|uniref:RNA-directed DNA polymerase, eukaryota, reverse transcriptase zinc-binding domain protein n=1 Tax=Tanacetum coccineum TaxID=301880 RepID=A0ABQ5J8U9_9ASTR
MQAATGRDDLRHKDATHSVVMATKLTKIGRRFAFVRFLKVTNTGSLIEDLKKIWIGTYHLFAAMARFERKPNDTPKSIPKPTNTHSHNQSKPASHSSHAIPNRSYATALNGKSSQNYIPKETVILKSVTLDVSDLIGTTDMRNVILLKVRDVHLILNINNVLRKEGFYDFQSKYIGGMWLWIEFGTTESCQKLQSNKEMSWYFTQMKHVSQSFKVDERVVWIEIDGLPLNAWTLKAYKKIEFAGWVPDIEAMDSLSGKNYDMGNSDNHDDGISDNGTQDAEEGEIRDTNEVREENVVNSHHFSWADDAEHIVKDHDDSSTGNQPMKRQKPLPKETSEAHKGDSKTISKPPGFKNYKPNSPRLSVGKNHQNSKQTSSSFTGAKSSRASKSHSKSFSNQGSMIEAFISHIEMGKVLGYDMEGSKNDLKKFIDSLEAKSGGLVSIWDPNTLTKLNVFPSENLLIVEVYEAEINYAIWDCGPDKSPGPDGFTFAFYKKIWDTIKDDVVDFVQDFFNTGILPHGCNTSFIALIPKIPNPMVVTDFRPISLIRSQYKIIAKVMVNRLAQVMHFMGFSEKWIKWIKAMEGLHVAVEDALSAGLYRGLKANTLTLSHFFFADDALFIGEWSRANIKSMVSILECFYQVSGLKINFHKSNLAGVGVPFEEFSKRLSKWKSSLLSIGGRSTLISSVLGAIDLFFWGSDANVKKIPWISWKLVLASKDKGGLGIGSLYSLNHALIQKWRWRFFNNSQSLWVLLIKAIHGENGDASSFYNHVRDQGVWGRIVRSINSMHEKGLVPHSFLQRRINNGASTKFWSKTWMGDSPLKIRFPHLFRLALNKDCTIRDR